MTPRNRTISRPPMTRRLRQGRTTRSPKSPLYHSSKCIGGVITSPPIPLRLANASIRFSTKSEMLVRAFGLVAAIGAGAAQVGRNAWLPECVFLNTSLFSAAIVRTFRQFDQRFCAICNHSNDGETRGSRRCCTDSGSCRLLPSRRSFGR